MPANERPSAREQRTVFGEVAQTYHRVRPSYPAALIDAVFAAAPPHPVAVEIGAGTGKATELLAPRCASLVAVEPSAQMADVAQSAGGVLDSVEFIVSTFEDWQPPPHLVGATDLVVCAQAWHWVEHATGLEKVASLLRPGGVFALFWNRPLALPESVRSEIDAAYAEVTPSLHEARPWESTFESDKAELMASPRFTSVTESLFSHEVTYITADYLDLMRTQSDHRLLAGDQLEQLLARLTGIINKHGGAVTRPYQTLLLLAHRR